jgi:hypothetical protein
LSAHKWILLHDVQDQQNVLHRALMRGNDGNFSFPMQEKAEQRNEAPHFSISTTAMS